MPDAASFKVDLAALHDAIGRVSRERDGMHGGIEGLRSTFRNVEDHWRSPAGNSFVALTTNFNSATDNLMAVLDEAIRRMQTSYDNYVQMEQTNTNNLRARESGGGGGSGNGGGSGGDGGSGAQTRMAMRSGAVAAVAGEPGAMTPLAMRSGAVDMEPQV